MRKTVFLKEKDVAKYTKEELIKLAEENNITLIGMKASIEWTEKFKNEKEKTTNT